MLSRSLSKVILILNSLKFSASNIAEQRARATALLAAAREGTGVLSEQKATGGTSIYLFHV